MKDLARKIKMEELDIPKIHGEVDIRFKNPMTGKIVKQIKGENTFQMAILASGLRNLGSAKASIYNAIESREPWKDIVGGIFLFRDSLPSGAKYMAAGNQMTANGSFGVTNNASPTELGSYNSNESSQSTEALTMVYDWTTSQGNGKISSVALTSRVGGYIGYGNKSETAHPTIKSFTEGLQLKRIQGINNTEFADAIQMNNMLYQFTYNSTDKAVTVKKSRVPLTQGSVFDWIPFDDEVIDVSDLHYEQVYLESGWQAFLDDGKIYLCPAAVYSRTTAVAAKFYVWEYNPANDEINEIEITNTSGESITWQWVSVSYGRFYVYAGEKTYVFNLSDSNYVGYIENKTGGTSHASLASDFPNGLSLIPINNSNNNPMYYRFYDPINRTCYPTNGHYQMTNMEGNLYYDPQTDTLNFYERYGAWAFDNPLYLATNYNLPSAVQKDATMTMQVRYTLQEA